MKKLHDQLASLGAGIAKAIANLGAAGAAWIAEYRRLEEIELIRAELHELRYWRELGTYREPRLYKRLVELGERVPGYMDHFEPEGLTGAWKGPA